jgi:2'-5' RNA ligase
MRIKKEDKPIKELPGSNYFIKLNINPDSSFYSTIKKIHDNNQGKVAEVSIYKPHWLHMTVAHVSQVSFSRKEQKKLKDDISKVMTKHNSSLEAFAYSPEIQQGYKYKEYCKFILNNNSLRKIQLEVSDLLYKVLKESKYSEKLETINNTKSQLDLNKFLKGKISVLDPHITLAKEETIKQNFNKLKNELLGNNFNNKDDSVISFDTYSFVSGRYEEKFQVEFD